MRDLTALRERVSGERGLLRSGKKKYAALLTSLRGLDGGAAVAFSGGVDSTLLLYAAHEALGERCIALTARSVFFPAAEATEAETLCERLGVKHVFLDVDVLAVPGVKDNPPERCYLCKRALLGAVRDSAARRGFSAVLEGANADDAKAWRPGAQAVKELGAYSPLLEAGLTKAEIRALSRSFGLPTADKPAMACLATRFPTGTALTAEDLQRAEAAEARLDALGFAQRRVRVHGDVARIEVPPEDFAFVTEHAAEIDETLRAQGFRYVALDLGGYKTGNMDQ